MRLLLSLTLLSLPTIMDDVMPHVAPVNLLRNSVATPYEIAENIVEAFRRVWPDTLVEAPRFAKILRYTILVLVTRGLTLLELDI